MARITQLLEEKTQEEHFAVLLAFVEGFYYVGMSVDELAHKMRTSALPLSVILRCCMSSGKG